MGETPAAPTTPRPEQTMPLLALITQRSLDADYEHVAARRDLFARGLQHRVGLPHPGSGAEEEGELAALGLALLFRDSTQ